MLFHKLYQVTASTIHNVICAQQTKNVRRAIADLFVSSQSPRHNMGVEGGGGGSSGDKRQRKTEIVTLAKSPSPSILFFFCTFVRNVDFRKT